MCRLPVLARSVGAGLSFDIIIPYLAISADIRVAIRNHTVYRQTKTVTASAAAAVVSLSNRGVASLKPMRGSYDQRMFLTPAQHIHIISKKLMTQGPRAIAKRCTVW